MTYKTLQFTTVIVVDNEFSFDENNLSIINSAYDKLFPEDNILTQFMERPYEEPRLYRYFVYCTYKLRDGSTVTRHYNNSIVLLEEHFDIQDIIKALNLPESSFTIEIHTISKL